MDKALKQRLVGATVLIILAVIVLPMLLGGRSGTLKQESRQIEMPDRPDELSIETRRFPVGVPNRPEVSSSQDAGIPEPADGSGEQSLVADGQGDSPAKETLLVETVDVESGTALESHQESSCPHGQ